MVIFANACSEPNTVMIKLKDTFITIMAVPGTRWLQKCNVEKTELRILGTALHGNKLKGRITQISVTETFEKNNSVVIYEAVVFHFVKFEVVCLPCC
jgi:hypothetical protein